MPVRDRLDELQAKRELLAKGEKKGNKATMNHSKEKTLTGFLTRSSVIDSTLNEYKARISEVKRLQQNLLSSPFAEKSDVNKYEALIHELTQTGVKIRTGIRALEEDAETSIKTQPDDEGFKRISKQQISGLTTQLAVATNEFFKCQSDYADKMKDRLRRQLSARGEGEVSEDRVNEILGADSYNVFTQNFISEVQDAEETLRELEERHKEMLALEKSVTDVNMLFKELNLMVSQQGEKLDNIESHIDQVEVTVQAGNEQLSAARVNQSKARKKKICCISIIVTVIVIIIIIIVVVSINETK